MKNSLDKLESISGHYYGITGLGLNVCKHNDVEYDDVFYFMPSIYGDVYEQAKKRMGCELRKQIRLDMADSASFLSPAVVSTDWRVRLENNAIVIDGHNEWNAELRVRYIGDENVFSPVTELDHEVKKAGVIAEYFNIMVAAEKNGDDRVRLSKRTGTVMFSVGFPRYRKNGDWWSSEHNYLSIDPGFAKEQMVCAGFISDTAG